MCTRFVFRSDTVITGFNFDIDLAVWNHRIVKESDCFYIGILRPDGMRHAYHGVTETGMREHCSMSTETRRGCTGTGRTA